jgi:hypothetical protein
LLQQAIAQAEGLIQQGAPLDDFIAETTMALQSSIMMLDGMVHGGAAGGAQDDIDALFD